MSERLSALAQLMPGKSTLEECSLEELEQLAKRFPYFAPAQFLLLQKLIELRSPEAEVQRHKAVLYFHDPLQFSYLTSPEKYDANDNAWKTLDNTEVATSNDQELPAAESEEVVTIPGNEIGVEEMIPPEEQPLVEEVPPLSEPLDENEASTANQDATPLADIDGHEETDNEDDSVKESVSNVMHLASGHDEVEPFDVRNDEMPSTGQPPTETAVATGVAPPIASPIPDQIQPTLQPSAEKVKEDFVFEPFHTVDYFASQGIKISADELPKDKLTKQLRSFTEWLKVMKRLPATEIAKAPHSTDERSVENLASHSVEQSDVITEAMAEVWTKQGAPEKAIETYNKLSLLNPSKKAYFAAKIENLKGS